MDEDSEVQGGFALVGEEAVGLRVSQKFLSAGIVELRAISSSTSFGELPGKSKSKEKSSDSCRDVMMEEQMDRDSVYLFHF